MKRIAHIVLPDGYVDAAEFAKDRGFRLASLSGDHPAELLIQRWRNQAREARSHIPEFDEDQTEEMALCQVDADRLDKCADDLFDVLFPNGD